MPSFRLRRSLPVLILLAALVLSHIPASASSLPSAVTHQDLGSSVWAWLSHLFQATWKKNGMTIDPDGQSVSEKNGMAIDPNGQPAATAPPGPHTDNGSMPDPDGLL